MYRFVEHALNGIGSFIDWLFPPMQQERYETRLRPLVDEYNGTLQAFEFEIDRTERLADELERNPKGCGYFTARQDALAGNLQLFHMERARFKTERAMMRIGRLQHRATYEHVLNGLQIYHIEPDDKGFLTLVPYRTNLPDESS